jgi:bacterioferritin (cytochrome b1)
MGLSKKEREKLISRISRASGIAQYALEAKMTDEHVIEAANHLKVFALIKDANNYNRYCQSQKTAEANAKLKQFLDPKNSEIYKAGHWLINALSKVGQDRKQSLLEKDLVYKNDYNDAVTDLRDTIKTQQDGITQQTSEAKDKIIALENRVDSLKGQLNFVRNYIINNYGVNQWQNIAKLIQNEKNR